MRKVIIGVVVGIFVTLIAGLAWYFGSVNRPQKSEAAAAAIIGGGLPPGCVCHSKEQPLVSMHNLFSVQDCRKCHDKNEKLIGKTGTKKMTKERLDQLKKRIQNEQICRECHKSGKLIAVKSKSKVAGLLFCPVEQKSYSKEKAILMDGKYYCPKDHGVELVDVDEIAIKSAKEPKNEYCVVCHQVNRSLTDQHTKVIETSGDSNIDDCLKCHTSHSKCDGCHF